MKTSNSTNDERPVSTTVHTTETLATAPARYLALADVASLTDRQLAFYHWREAMEQLGSLEHQLKDYGDETSSFERNDAKNVEAAAIKISKHMRHVVAIVIESFERTRDAAAPAKQGGAK